MRIRMNEIKSLIIIIIIIIIMKIVIIIIIIIIIIQFISCLFTCKLNSSDANYKVSTIT
jgi:hypothetical protein